MPSVATRQLWVSVQCEVEVHIRVKYLLDGPFWPITTHEMMFTAVVSAEYIRAQGRACASRTKLSVAEVANFDDLESTPKTLASLRTGVHHAELTARCRSVIEPGFSQGKLLVMSSTYTLVAGAPMSVQ